jgi:hypothetical protein
MQFIILDPYKQPLAVAEAASAGDVSAFIAWARSRAEEDTTENWTARARGEAPPKFDHAIPLEEMPGHEQFRKAFAMSEAAANLAVLEGLGDLPTITIPPQGDGTPAAEPDDQLTAAYRRAWGLTEAQATVAAHGAPDAPAATKLPSVCSAPSKSCAYRVGKTSPQLNPPKPLVACMLANQPCPYDTPKA